MNASIRQFFLGALTATLLLLLGACERTQFTQAPADATGCNAALVGDWLSEPTEDNAPGEVVAHVGGDCALQITENDRSPPRHSPPTNLRSAKVGDLDLLWIDAAWADAAFELEADAITPGDDSGASDVYLFVWKRDGEQLTLIAPDHHALAHSAIDGDIKAEVLRREYELHVRVREPQAKLQSLLASGKAFGDGSGKGESLRFVRATGKAGAQ